MKPAEVHQQMREEWNARAREDAHYFVAFGRRDQDDEEFFSTGSGLVGELVKELKRLPASTPSGKLRALEIGCGPGRLLRPMDGSQEGNALKVNMEAAEEIGRQLRLRDLGGIIVIDFIDMKNPENKRILQQKMKEIMDSDRATHTILPLSKFNLMQITRERVRPEVNISTTEACPTCGGTGEINASLLLIDEMEQDLDHLLNTHTKLKLYCHPIFAAYLQKGFPSRRMNWFIKYKKWVRIYQNEDFAITEYKFFDDNDEEIKID